MKYILIRVIAFSSLLFSGCDTLNPSDPVSGLSDKSSFQLDGTWISDNDKIVIKDSFSSRTRVEEDDRLKVEYFKTMRFDKKGVKTLSTPSLKVNKVNIVLIKQKEINTPKTQEVVDFYNNYSRCAHTDWQLNVGIELPYCMEQNNTGKSFQTIIYIKDDTLQMGDRNGEKDAESYPETLSEEIYYRN